MGNERWMATHATLLILTFGSQIYYLSNFKAWKNEQENSGKISSFILA
jgi:hypothetical protein